MTFIVKCAPVLKEWRFCCCSCSLRAAAIVLAWFSLVTNISQLITCIIYLTHPIYMHNQYGVGDNENVLPIPTEAGYGFTEDRDEEHGMAYCLKKSEVYISLLTTVVGSLILDALLLYGIHNKKPTYMLPYLVMDLVGLVVLVALILFATVLVLPTSWPLGLFIFLSLSAILALMTFLWVVMYSYYRQIEEEKNANAGIVNYTYGIPSGQVQISNCPEDEKALCPYPNKMGTQLA